MFLAAVSGAVWGAESGRWTWDASVGVDSFSRTSEVAGASTTDYDQRAIRLRAGADGYIVHPLIGRFRIDGDTYLLNRSSGSGLDSDRFGLGARVNLFPRGDFPTNFLFRREAYEYSGAAADNPLTRVGAPDLGRRWSARTQIRRGFLQGSSMGFDRGEIEFDDPSADTERRASEFFRWARSGRSLRHVLHLEHNDVRYGTTDLSTDEYLLTLSESASIAANWRWNLNGTGFRREYVVADDDEELAERAALNTQFTRSFGGAREFDLAYEISHISTDPGFRTLGQRLSASHRTPIGAGWSVAPTLSYGYLESDLLDTRSPSAGVAFDWQRTHGRLRTTASLDTNVGWIETDDGTMEERERRLGYGASGSIGGGDPQRLRTEFSLGYSGSEVSLDQEPIVELPDLGLLDGALGTEDRYSARLDLEHRNDGTSLNGWIRWMRRESAPVGTQLDRESETLTGMAQYGIRRFALQGTAGRTSVEREEQPGQEVLRGAISARWRPWSPLSTRLSYAVDRRTVTQAPDVDGRRLELIADLRLGGLRLEVRLYENEDQVENEPARVNRGFRWSVSTRFEGGLPVYSGTKRRGVIR